MTETSDIGTAITAICALNLKDLTVCNTYYAALVSVAALIDALSDADIDGYDEATVTAAMKLMRDALGELVDKEMADYLVRFRNTA